MSARPSRVLASLIGAGALIVGPLSVPANAAEVEVQILGINDFHGRLESGFNIPGAAKLGGVVDRLRAEMPDSTVFVSAGDNVGASTFTSSSQEDAPTIEALNAMGLDAGAVGNHEFDRGYDWLADPATHGVDGLGLAEWPSLGANVGGSELAPSAVIETTAGVDVGLIGVVTEQTPTLVDPTGIQGLTFTDPVAAANAEADRLKGDDLADVVILLTHEGTEDTDCANIATTGAFGDIVTNANANIDAILSGHTHTKYYCTVGDRPVMQTGQYGSGLDRLVMTVDTATNEVVSVDGAKTGVVDVATDPAAANAEIAQIVADAKAAADVIGNVPVGEIFEDIERGKNPDGSENRGKESVLGNFIADVQLEATRKLADEPPVIAFMNPGGLRADFRYAKSGAETEDGIVTYGEAAVVQPFANTLFTMDLTGAQVKQILEEQWQPTGSSRPFLHLGVSEGLTYTYDPSLAEGSRITSIDLDGAPIDPAGTYRVAMNSFLAAGGDNFATFKAGTNKLDTGQDDLDALITYFEENSPVLPSRQERAIIDGQYVDQWVEDFQISGPDTLTPGERGTVTMGFLVEEDIDGEFVASMLVGDGMAVVDLPDECEVTDSIFVDCTYDGFAEGPVAVDLTVVGLSNGRDIDSELVAFLYSPQFDGNPFSPDADFFAIKDVHVLDGELNGRQSDLDDDGTADVVALDGKGRLLLYPGDGFGGFGPSSLVGTGFGGPVLLPGDLNGDQVDDVMYQTPSGALYAYANRGNGTLSRGVLVFTGFRNWTLMGPGDWDGDGKSDLIARSPGGQLYLFAGKGNGTFGKAKLIGKGWGSFTELLTPGDFDGDGNVDLIGRSSSNRLYLYPGSGTGGFGSRSLVATGWSFPGSTAVGDFDGDLVADLIAKTSSGALYAYSGNGAGGISTPPVKIGVGWGGLKLVG